jgi:hypothetical protein
MSVCVDSVCMYVLCTLYVCVYICVCVCVRECTMWWLARKAPSEIGSEKKKKKKVPGDYCKWTRLDTLNGNMSNIGRKRDSGRRMNGHPQVTIRN